MLGYLLFFVRYDLIQKHELDEPIEKEYRQPNPWQGEEDIDSFLLPVVIITVQVYRNW